jgi:hypothetical protein
MSTFFVLCNLILFLPRIDLLTTLISLSVIVFLNINPFNQIVRLIIVWDVRQSCDGRAMSLRWACDERTLIARWSR